MKITLSGEPVVLSKEMYNNNKRIAITATCEDGEPYATVTVNIPSEPLKEDEVIIDTNNLGEGVIIELKEQKVIGERVGFAHSGYCTYPIHKILI